MGWLKGGTFWPPVWRSPMCAGSAAAATDEAGAARFPLITTASWRSSYSPEGVWQGPGVGVAGDEYGLAHEAPDVRPAFLKCRGRSGLVEIWPERT